MRKLILILLINLTCPLLLQAKSLNYYNSYYDYYLQSLSSQLQQERTTRATNDGILDGKISQEAYWRDQGDRHLNKLISSESQTRSIADNQLQSQLNSTNERLNLLDDKINDLTKPSYMLGLKVRVLDTRKFTVEVYNNYGVAHRRNGEVGLTVTYKLGSSYEERKIEELERMIYELKRGNRPAVE